MNLVKSLHEERTRQLLPGSFVLPDRGNIKQNSSVLGDVLRLYVLYVLIFDQSMTMTCIGIPIRKIRKRLYCISIK